VTAGLFEQSFMVMIIIEMSRSVRARVNPLESWCQNTLNRGLPIPKSVRVDCDVDIHGSGDWEPDAHVMLCFRTAASVPTYLCFDANADCDGFPLGYYRPHDRSTINNFAIVASCHPVNGKAVNLSCYLTQSLHSIIGIKIKSGLCRLLCYAVFKWCMTQYATGKDPGWYADQFASLVCTQRLLKNFLLSYGPPSIRGIIEAGIGLNESPSTQKGVMFVCDEYFRESAT